MKSSAAKREPAAEAQGRGRANERAISPVLTVTSPLLPELESVLPYLQDVLDRRWVTNNGKYVQMLEKALEAHLGVSEVAAVTNATVGLDLAVRALVDEGEVITTGYSFPATYHVLMSNGRLTPVFADIDEDFGLDPEAVRAAITSRTKAILAVHTYGYPCALDRLANLAREYDLKLIYDAAHTFGVKIGNRGIGSFGDLSVFSFHATKVFNTLEGGCITPGVYAQGAMEKVRLLRNFGIRSEEEVVEVGVNGKMDEVRAVFGLATLPLVSDGLARRKMVVEHYLSFFRELEAPQVEVRWNQYTRSDVALNYAYFPVLIHPSGGFNRDLVYATLKRQGILARKYFHPVVTDLPLYRGLCDPAKLRRTAYASGNVLCLPVHHDMTLADCVRVEAAFTEAFREGLA